MSYNLTTTSPPLPEENLWIIGLVLGAALVLVVGLMAACMPKGRIKTP